MNAAVLPESVAWQNLRVQRQGPVLRVTLNRLELRNAMSLALVAELQDVLGKAEADGTTRVLVLSGAGGHFCAGADLKDMSAARGQTVAPELAGTADDPIARTNAAFGQLCVAYARSGLATLAALQGSVMGGGFGLACVVDVTLADPSVRFRLPETGLGLLPAQIAPFLVERLGIAQARRLAVTGATLDAAQALAIGLVHEVCEADTLDAGVQRQLDAILRCAPGAIAATKRLMAEGLGRPPETMVQLAATAFAQAARGHEAREGLAAFAARRPPAWADAQRP